MQSTALERYTSISQERSKISSESNAIPCAGDTSHWGKAVEKESSPTRANIVQTSHNFSRATVPNTQILLSLSL